MGARFRDDYPAEAQEADQVWEGHEAVGGIGEIPHRLRRLDGTEKHRPHPEDPVGFDRALTEEVFGRLFTIVTPAQNGGKDEGEQAKEQDDWSGDMQVVKGRGG